MKRKPVFSLTPEQVMAICRKNKFADILGGAALALMSLMAHGGCTMKELAQRSGVARSMISKILALKSFPTTRVLNDLVSALGSDLGHFFILAGLEARAQVSL